MLSRHVFYVKQKRVDREQTSGETERDRPLLIKGCGVGNKLDPRVKLFTMARERIIQGLINMTIKLIPTISDC